ncbi:DinB family protein [Blastopirellula marina]|uniref:DinB-like domain-containing protein n=1 Tax=Blastopirellula marina TaxID=124 RepID=A0A2S8GLT1_9BACT|nr:DinB family protein [Blastopirellula marina]PQO45396.1 hypothetical protein C5Y93_13165 [Blastopirellula marina]
MANQTSAALLFPLLEDLGTAPLVTPTGKGGNHAHWTLGHLVFSEAGLTSIRHNTTNPHASLESFFGRGVMPTPDGAGYPAYDELLAELKSLHSAAMSELEGLSEEDLDQACPNIPEEIKSLFGTWRQAFMMRPLHWMNHRGQLADCRRAAGREPLML